MTAPETTTDELTAHWSTVPENMAAVRKQLEPEANELEIMPDNILTEALRTLGLTQWSDYPGKGGDAIFAVKEAWRKQAAPYDDGKASQPSGHDEPQVQTASDEPIRYDKDRPDGNQPIGLPSGISIQPQNSLAGIPAVAQWEVMRQQAQILVKSGFLPKDVNTPEKAIAIMMMGQALNIEPIVALNTINVISGKPTVSPQLMLALVRRSGQLESFKVSDDGQCCTVEMKRRGEPLHIEKFSMEDAQRMKTTEYVNGNKTTISLSEKYNWKAQPAVMRKWRAIAAACRVVFPDVTWGIASYTTEEIDPDIVIEAEVA